MLSILKLPTMSKTRNSEQWLRLLITQTIGKTSYINCSDLFYYIFSHFVEAQTGMQMLSDALITTPIYQGAEGSGMGGGLGGFEGGAQMDPELEMVRTIVKMLTYIIKL